MRTARLLVISWSPLLSSLKLTLRKIRKEHQQTDRNCDTLSSCRSQKRHLKWTSAETQNDFLSSIVAGLSQRQVGVIFQSTKPDYKDCIDSSCLYDFESFPQNILFHLHLNPKRKWFLELERVRWKYLCISQTEFCQNYIVICNILRL